jgi:hypothetical protein
MNYKQHYVEQKTIDNIIILLEYVGQMGFIFSAPAVSQLNRVITYKLTIAVRT